MISQKVFAIFSTGDVLRSFAQYIEIKIKIFNKQQKCQWGVALCCSVICMCDCGLLSRL